MKKERNDMVNTAVANVRREVIADGHREELVVVPLDRGDWLVALLANESDPKAVVWPNEFAPAAHNVEYLLGVGNFAMQCALSDAIAEALAFHRCVTAKFAGVSTVDDDGTTLPPGEYRASLYIKAPKETFMPMIGTAVTITAGGAA